MKWIIPRHPLVRLLMPLLAFATIAGSPMASAVPSYARQVGVSCAACHTTIPELTAFGRSFKQSGYTLASGEQVQSPGDLSIDRMSQLSMMLQVGFTHVAKSDPTVQNNDIQFPQQLSLFYAGRITPEIGVFSQLTYDQESDKFNWDNVDIRYAHSQGKLTYGATLNNAPTVEDLWNSTPVWGYPYEGSATAPGPMADSLIDRLAQDSVGLGGYAMYDNAYYGDVTLYRSAHLGMAQADNSTDNINGVAPYWRFAWQPSVGKDSFMLGTYGMTAQIIPADTTRAGVSGPHDRYTDVAVDSQYDHPMGGDQVTVHASYLRERASPNAGSAFNTNFLRVDGTYHLKHVASFSLGAQAINGDADASRGTVNNKPDSTAYIADIAYLPWQNTKFVMQYTAFSKFDGVTKNATDNNSLYLLAWFVL